MEKIEKLRAYFYSSYVKPRIMPNGIGITHKIMIGCSVAGYILTKMGKINLGAFQIVLYLAMFMAIGALFNKNLIKGQTRGAIAGFATGVALAQM